MIKFLFIATFILSTITLFSQQNNLIDSLEQCLKTAKADTNKINILDDLSWNLCYADQNKALQYAQQQLALSKKINYKKGEANAYVNLGSVSFLKGNLTDALKNFKIAYKLKIARGDKIGAAGLLNNIAMIYKQQGNYKQSIENIINAAKIFEQINDKSKMASAYNNIGAVYQELKNYQQSLYYFNKAKEIRVLIDEKDNLSATLNNIGNCYVLLNKYDEAFKYFDMALDAQKGINNKYIVARVLNSKATIYKTLKNYNKAIDLYKKSINIKETINDAEGLLAGYLNIGEIYLIKKDADNAINYFNKIQDIIDSTDSKENLTYLYNDFVKAYQLKNNYKKALEYSQLYSIVKDSIFSDLSVKQITEMQTKYETEKKELENSKLIKENEIKELKINKAEQTRKVYLIIALNIILLIIVITILIIYRFKQKQKAQILKETIRQDKLRYKAIIDSEENERIRIAKELHDGLGQLLSSAKLNISSFEDSIDDDNITTYKNSINIIDEAVGEVRNISHNLMPTALTKYGLIEAINSLAKKINDSKQINVSFNHNNINISLEKETEIAIYRIVQEIINNMLKHSKASLINILLQSDNNTLSIEISDNGTGFNTNEITNSKGIGWQNIYSRVSMINGKITVNSLTDKGTNIKITI